MWHIQMNSSLIFHTLKFIWSSWVRQWMWLTSASYWQGLVFSCGRSCIFQLGRESMEQRGGGTNTSLWAVDVAHFVWRVGGFGETKSRKVGSWEMLELKHVLVYLHLEGLWTDSHHFICVLVCEAEIEDYVQEKNAREICSFTDLIKRCQIRLLNTAKTKCVFKLLQKESRIQIILKTVFFQISPYFERGLS